GQCRGSPGGAASGRAGDSSGARDHARPAIPAHRRMEPDQHETAPRPEEFMIQLMEETRGGWCIVGVRGRLDAESADELESALRGAIGKHAKVAANFAGVDYISSAGLRAVIQAARAAG